MEVSLIPSTCYQKLLLSQFEALMELTKMYLVLVFLTDILLFLISEVSGPLSAKSVIYSLVSSFVVVAFLSGVQPAALRRT